jgi:Protein HRI1
VARWSIRGRWRDIRPLGEKVGWVLKAQGQGMRGVVVRIGGFAQGVLRRGSEVGVKRWRFMGGEKRWDPIIAIGVFEIPEEVFGDKASGMVEGDKFVGGDGLEWACVERFEGDW